MRAMHFWGLVVVLSVVLVGVSAMPRNDNNEDNKDKDKNKNKNKNKDKKQEGFAMSDESATVLQKLQQTLHPGLLFDPDAMDQQTTEDEQAYFLKHKRWPWSADTVQRYEDAMRRNPYIREDVRASVEHARSIYPEQSILRILFYQSPEGLFLLRGFRYGNDGPVVRCNLNDVRDPHLEMVTTAKADSGDTSTAINIRRIQPRELPGLIPGFRFAKGQAPCNPCAQLLTYPYPHDEDKDKDEDEDEDKDKKNEGRGGGLCSFQLPVNNRSSSR